MPPADTTNNLLATSVSHSNGFTTFSFIRPLSTGDASQDIDLTSPRFFVYGFNGTATFSNGRIASVGQHPRTPIISNERVTLGTPEQCPGKEREREREKEREREREREREEITLFLSFLCPSGTFPGLNTTRPNNTNPNTTNTNNCNGGYMTGCANGRCLYNATWTVRGDHVKFEVTGIVPQGHWIAIAFSDDRRMVNKNNN